MQFVSLRLNVIYAQVFVKHAYILQQCNLCYRFAPVLQQLLDSICVMKCVHEPPSYFMYEFPAQDCPEFLAHATFFFFFFLHTLVKRWRNIFCHQKLGLLYLASLLLSMSFALEPNPSCVIDGSSNSQQSSCPENNGQQTPSDSNHHTPSSLSPRNSATCNLLVSWRERRVTCDNFGQWFLTDC